MATPAPADDRVRRHGAPSPAPICLGFASGSAGCWTRSRPDVALCDVTGVEPDAVTVDALARLQLAAQRYGCQVRLRHASSELVDLLGFMGLREVVPE